MKFLMIVVALFLLPGCAALKEKPVKVEQRVEHVQIFHPALPPGVSIQKFGDGWKVMTPEIMEEYVQKWKNGEEPDMVFYALTVEDYEILAKNIAEIKKELKDYKEIIIYYRSLK